MSRRLAANTTTSVPDSETAHLFLSDVTKALSSLHSLASSGESEDADGGRDLNNDGVCEILRETDIRPGERRWRTGGKEVKGKGEKNMKIKDKKEKKRSVEIC